MVYPIYVYGHPVLRKIAPDIKPDYPGLKDFIVNLFETMEKSDGIGLAAPQVGKPIRIFVLDTEPLAEDNPNIPVFKKAFINPHIIERSGEMKIYNEGCLSLPTIHEEVERPASIRIQYMDEQFVSHEEDYDGIVARIIQHEYDHLDGTLFIDRIPPIRRKMLAGKLKAISKGKVDIHYKIKTGG
jgi:peptide deformylase